MTITHSISSQVSNVIIKQGAYLLLGITFSNSNQYIFVQTSNITLGFQLDTANYIQSFRSINYFKDFVFIPYKNESTSPNLFVQQCHYLYLAECAGMPLTLATVSNSTSSLTSLSSALTVTSSPYFEQNTTQQSSITVTPSILKHVLPLKLTKLIKPYGISNLFIIPYNKTGVLQNLTIAGHCTSFFMVLDFVLTTADTKLTLFANSSNYE